MKKTEPVVLIKLISMWLCFAMVAGICGVSVAQENKSEKPPFNKQLLDGYSGKIEIAYVIPRPAVIQQVLEERQFAFTGQIKPNLTADYSGSATIALNLGARCTDGIMMVYGDNRASDQELEELGATIMTLTENLGLKDKLKEIDNLKKALKAKDQEEIKKSIDMLFAESEDLLRRDDSDLAMLVSLGGWVELMYYASEELSKNYQAESSKVLAMDYIVDVYISALSNVNVFVQDTPVLSFIAKQLPQVRVLMHNPADHPLSREAVNGIYSIAKNVKQEIEKQ